MARIVEINTTHKCIKLEHLKGGFELLPFAKVPEDFQEFYGPADKVVELAYWLGVESGVASSV